MNKKKIFAYLHVCPARNHLRLNPSCKLSSSSCTQSRFGLVAKVPEPAQRPGAPRPTLTQSKPRTKTSKENSSRVRAVSFQKSLTNFAPTAFAGCVPSLQTVHCIKHNLEEDLCMERVECCTPGLSAHDGNRL